MSKKVNSMYAKRIGLLFDSVSSNTGDIAIGIALKQVLEKRGFIPEIMDPFNYDASEYSTIIVGGGQLLRDPGDMFYDHFRVKGKCILNSVGVSGTKDFDYLKDYLYISTRSTYESSVIEKHVNYKVPVVPCTTTLLKSKKYTVPGLKLKQGEKVVGIHLVPDVLINCPDIVQIINAIPHKKVFIPFTHYNQDASFMKSLPFDKSNSIVLDKLEPLELHSVISQMDYVIVSSLHASIFAYTQNVPFISMYQKKAYDYFKDRNLDEYVYKSQDQLVKLISKVEKESIDMCEQISKDVNQVNSAIDKFVEIINESPIKKSKKTLRDDQSSQVSKLKLKVEQLETVVEKRDILIHNMIYESMRSNEAKLTALRLEVTELNNELQVEKEKRVGRRIKRIIVKVKRSR